MTGILKKSQATVKNGSGSADHADQPQHKETDILIDRFLEYKSITKGLTSYYQGLADAENHSANELEKIGGHLPVPLREGNQFLPEGGWQSILYNSRDRTRAVGQHHKNFAHTITSGVVGALNRTKNDIKHFIEELVSEPSRLASEVGKQRAESTRLITQLAMSIANAKSNPHALSAKDDPVILHRQIETQLRDQIAAENALTRSVIAYQKKSAELEKRVNIEIQLAIKEYETARLNAREAIDKEWAKIHEEIMALDPELEWKEFAQRSSHLIPEDIQMRDPDRITFPGQDDETTKPVKSGLLERKKRFTKNYTESFYVLTPSGYLHEHKSSDPTRHAEPEMSLFLPNCVLGPTAPEGAKAFKWHLEAKKKTSGGYNSGSLNKLKNTLRIGKKDVAYSFKARSNAEMTEWWKLMQHPAKASYTAATVKSGLEEGAAVKAVIRAGLDSDNSNVEHTPETVTTHKNGTPSVEEELGGSSEEEEESTHSIEAMSTAPTTPAAGATHASPAPVKGNEEAEVLPGYKKGEAPAAHVADLKEKPDLPNHVNATEQSASN
ncbi:hypothetical protein PPACK8108_LOCUS7488 [Phakopsora pachyrhizi]|uniref:PH domain-containing protein n=1 Tax=Phakopsora pachyrhizi TaxID=170000 RepID=A0AAV0AXG5_PHAPC|nr:hypothetical protein PPACK8108_LOCUS7488 [Phakopsora pachyrhizi]